MSDRAEPVPPPVPVGHLAPGTRVLLTLGGFVLVTVGLALGRNFVGPLALAAVVVIVVQPIQRSIERRHGPRWLATVAVILVAYLILIGMGLLIALAAHQFAVLVAKDADQVSELVDSASTALKGIGVDLSHAQTTGGFLDPQTAISAAKAIGSYVASSAIAIFFVFAYILFMAADAAHFADLPSEMASRKARTLASLQRYCSGVRRYFVVSTIFGLIVAVLDGLLLWALNVPGALIWAILAFVTNFIPNIGFILGLIPAAVFALISGGWVIAVVVVLAYCAINVLMQEFIQPKFVAEAVHLSLTLTFASVIFWAAVLGPIGALLAIPLTLFVRELLIGSDPNAGWSRWLSGDRLSAGG